jgi:DNA-binding NarL/FixJ family response regulator
MASLTVVAVVHASPLVLEGLIDLLRKQTDVRVAGAFTGAGAVLAQPPQGECIVLYDLETSHRDGPDLMANLRRLPGVKILVFGVADDDQAIIECVQAGASGCVLRDASLDDLMSAIRSLASGNPPVSPRVVTTLFSYVARLQAGDDPPPATPLTAREEQILQLIVQGLTNKEIAQRLYLRPQTVKNYVHLVLQKMNLRSRLEAIRAARSGKH